MAKKLSTKDNFVFLLAALLLLLFTTAVVEQFAGGAGQRVIVATTVITLIIGIWSIRNEKIWFRTGIGFTISIVLVAIGGFYIDRAGLDFLHLLIMLGFFVLTAYIAARQVLLTGDITHNKIIGAICIFLLLGLIWAMFYLLLLEIDPNTFNNLTKEAWYDNFPKIVYFSFVTLTTLGYGDVTPALPLAQFLAYIEATFGLFYIAVMVASVVSVRVSQLTREHQKQNTHDE